jgi:hypothetical protein
MGEEQRIDVALIRYQARARWMAEQRRRITFLDRVEMSVPWWLIIIAATLFALSAPHTAATFAALTPAVGVIAPFFVEFGLLYAAFRRKQLRQRGEKVPEIVWLLEVLLFVTAVVVNGAGAFSAVIAHVGLGELSFGQMLGRFGDLPATSQVALFLVPVAALIVPIGTAVAGEGLAALVLERKQVRDDFEERWNAVAPQRLYTAFFDALIDAEVTVGKANQLAQAYARSAYLSVPAEKDGKGQKDKGQITDGEDSKKTPVDTPEQASGQAKETENGQFSDTPEQAQGTAGTAGRRARNPNAYTDAVRLLSENPDWIHLSVRALEQQTGISKSVWDKAKDEQKIVRSNGHGEGVINE